MHSGPTEEWGIMWHPPSATITRVHNSIGRVPGYVSGCSGFESRCSLGRGRGDSQGPPRMPGGSFVKYRTLLLNSVLLDARTYWIPLLIVSASVRYPR